MQTAWELSREHGLAGLSLRELARRLGMASPSLYGYFASKEALYDAMFAEGYRAFLALDRVEAEDLREEIRLGAHQYVGFCIADPVRYQLLFQRTIPGFSPSPESYALALEVYERDLGRLRRFGLDQSELDLVGAVFSGIVAQQLANEPGSTRWVDLVDRAADMVADDIERRRPQRREAGDARRPAPSTRPRRRKS